ncbi:peroxidase [Planctomycetes bacterium MalM25]|nr:peroxidase [Planctomycetes bacterium MalM25]
MQRRAEGARPPRGRNEKLEDRQLLAADLGAELESLDPLLESSVLEVASIDGSNNNLDNPDWGAAGTALQRLTTVEYADSLSDPAGDDLPSAREVSNAVADQDSLVDNDRYLTDFVWLWGQFIDHDLDLSVHADPAEAFDIEVPLGDAEFDPFATGEVTIGLERSDYVVDDEGVRQQVNSITAYLDGSVVYGPDEETAASLRCFEGGRMLTSEGDLLPIGEDGFFLAGDVRANENVALTSMHTLWVREHNRLADEIASVDPSLSDEEIYQQARALVTAQIQAITYNQWLPALLGVDAIDSYSGYDPDVNAGIANVFSTAAYRFGHSMLSTELLRLNADGTVADEGNLSLSDAFFSPGEVLDHGIESLLLGASEQVAQEIDTMIVDDVRNFLFGPPGAGGLDLASLNIQRGRDHGLADYNQVREDYGLLRVQSFSEITSDEELAAKLEALYGSVDDIDLWVGVLAEDHVAGASLGELGRTILVDQFTRLRDGDRYWYENRYEGETLSALRSTTLADVIERNTDIEGLRDNVFLDDSVLYYAADPDAPRMDVMLHVQQGELRLIDNGSGKMLAAVPADEATGVSLVGTAGDDRVLIHPSAMRLGLAAGVVVDGQTGRHDTVVLRGDPRIDTASIDGAFAQLGETAVQVEGVDRLVIDASLGPDQIEVIEEGEYDLVVDNDQGQRQRERRDRLDRGPQAPLAPRPLTDMQAEVRLDRDRPRGSRR